MAGGGPIKTAEAVKYRRSRIRTEILEFLRKTENHPSAEEVHSQIKLLYPSASYGTVYRNLNILVKQGEAKRLESSRGKDRFDAQLPFHAHFKCDVCGEILDIPFDTEEMIEDIEARTGHRIGSHSIEFHGICASCSRKS